MTDPNRTVLGAPTPADPNRTVLGAPNFDPNRTVMGAPTFEATTTIKPVQCPICKTFNPIGVMFCVECGLIFDRALPEDAFGAPTVRLPVLVGKDGREMPLRMGATTLGRQGDVVIEDPRVSRQHCRVTLADGAVTVEDLGSTNGTMIAGQRLAPNTPTPLPAGGVVSLGGLELTLQMPGEGAKTQLGQGGRTAQMTAIPTTSDAPFILVLPDREVPLAVGRHTFGRRDGNAVVISDPFVSGQHGHFDVTPTEATLTDTGSTNGTLVNEAKLAVNVPTVIGPADVIKLGQMELRIRPAGGAA